MLIEEAQWLGDQLHRLDARAVFPLLDVGSSTAQFRTREQPWIDRFIFAPARDLGHRVVHLDAKDAPGVDLVADLADPMAVEKLATLGFRSVLCSNLLEHVVERQAIADALVRIVPPHGYLFVSGPYRYPAHPDPIDTRWRPTPVELGALFPRTKIATQAIVRDGSYLDEIRRTPAAFARLLIRLLLPFYKPRVWRREVTQFVRYLPWTLRRFEASCTVLVRDL